MKLNREKLVEACKAVMSGVAIKEIIPQSSNFFFQHDRIYSFNDEMSVSYPFEVGFEGAVPAKEFLAFISKVKSEQITLKLDKDELLLVGSKAKAGLRLEEISLTLDVLDTPEKWIELSAEFKKAVNFCLFTVSKDNTKEVLQNIHITNKYAESCDNYRITRFNFSEKTKAFSEAILLPAYAAKQILTQNIIQYGLTDGWLHFKNDDDVVFSCRTVSDEYLDFSNFLNVKGVSFSFPQSVIDVVDRSSVLSDGERITVILENELLTVSCENRAGWFEESVKLEYDGDSVEFEINPGYIKEILKLETSVIMNDTVLCFQNDNFKHVIKLLKK